MPKVGRINSSYKQAEHSERMNGTQNYIEIQSKRKQLFGKTKQELV
jgi:hypothetical protein